MPDPETEGDPQDVAETLDDDTLGVEGDGEDTFEDLPEAPDFTRAVGDDDDEAGLIGEDLSDEEIVELEQDSAEADLEDDELAARAEEVEPEVGAAAGDSDQS